MAPEKVTYRYYRGQFRSQFQLGPYQEFAAGRSKQFHVELEPKFQLFQTQATTPEEFAQQIQCTSSDSDCNCKLHTRVDYQVVRSAQRTFMELYPGMETREGRLALVDAFAVFYTYEGLRDSAGVGGFYAKDGKSGKFTGEAFLRVVEDEQTVSEALQEKEKLENRLFNGIIPPMGKGCFGRSSNTGLNDLGASPGGCFNRRLPFGGASGIGGPSTLGGCFNAGQQPGGCFSMGWLGRLLGLLGLLGLLLYLLSMLQTCGRAASDNVVYIHDTVVVEVVKERVDTLEVVRIDTAKFLTTNKVETTDMVPLPNVQFETDKDVLVPGSLPDIQKLAEFLIKKKHIKAKILGHTDNVGDPAHNVDLSKRRARAVKDMLVRLGVDASRIESEGYGPSRPKASNDTQEGRLMNRRVEVQLTNTVQKTEETIELKKRD